MSKGITIGLDNIYYAIMNDENLETYDTPVRVPGAVSVTVTPTTNSTTFYSDDKADEVFHSLGDIAMAITSKNLTTAMLADLLGHTVDSNGGLVRSNNDRAPYVAIGYRRLLSTGKYRYIWNYKGKFQPETQDAQTKGQTVTPQTPSISGTFLPRDTGANDWQYTITDGDPGVTSGFLTNFFNNVILPNADTTPPTVTVAPLDAATAVPVGSSIVWTFSKAIRDAAVNSANFMLQKADGSAQVAGTLSIDATKKIVTFTPTASLAAATKYMGIATVGVKDLAGNALAAPKVSQFTTA